MVGGLSVAALVGLISNSLRPGALLGGSYGTDAWRRLISDPTFGDALIFTIRSAAIATVLSVLIAVPLAFALRRASSFSRALIAFPIPIAHLVVASVLVLWLGPGGLLDRTVGTLPIVADSFGWGVIVVYVLKEVPFLTVLALAAFGDEDQRREEAARTLGASRWERWRAVLIPRVGGPMLLGSLVVAAFVVGSPEVPLEIGNLAPDALTTWSITTIRIRGPIARADAAAALVVTSLVVLFLAAIAIAIGLRRARRTNP